MCLCCHGILHMHPIAVVGGDGLQILRVADRCSHPACRLGKELMTPHCKKWVCFKCNTGGPGTWDSLEWPKFFFLIDRKETGLQGMDWFHLVNAFCIPEDHGHNYVYRIDCFEPLCWRGAYVFPTLSPSFSPMLLYAPCFIASDNLVQGCSWLIHTKSIHICLCCSLTCFGTQCVDTFL